MANTRVDTYAESPCGFAMRVCKASHGTRLAPGCRPFGAAGGQKWSDPPCLRQAGMTSGRISKEERVIAKAQSARRGWEITQAGCFPPWRPWPSRRRGLRARPQSDQPHAILLALAGRLSERKRNSNKWKTARNATQNVPPDLSDPTCLPDSICVHGTLANQYPTDSTQSKKSHGYTASQMKGFIVRLATYSSLMKMYGGSSAYGSHGLRSE
jgi:hypothetical protein